MFVAHEWNSRTDADGDKVQIRSRKERVEAEARARLRESAYAGVRPILCEYYEGVLTLRGRVASYYLKQVAQTLVAGMAGVGEINNRLEVDPTPGR
jgi:osmotically-inducible protein OsmY